jgi:outer membrane receptor protein involved in Fe transport
VGDPPLKQVVGKSWEAGATGTLSGSWAGAWLLSAYRTVTANDIQFTAASTRGRAFFRNIGTTRRRGVEVSLSAARGPVSVRLGYAFTDARFGSAFVVNSPDNPAADADGRIFVSRGDHIPGIPRHRAIASVDYEFGSFSLGADMQAQSGQPLRGDESNDQPKTQGYTMINLRSEMKLGKAARLFGEVTNVLNVRFATFGAFSQTDEVALQEVPGADNPRALSPGAPRRFLLGLRIGF